MQRKQFREPECPEDEENILESECQAYAENPVEYVESEICPDCPHSQEIKNPELLGKIIYYIDILSGGCPVGRHELLNIEWALIGFIKNELERLNAQESREASEAAKAETREERLIQNG